MRMGWGQVGKGCSITSRASNSSSTMNLHLVDQNSDFSDVEVFTHCGNGVTQLTGSFNGGSSFTFPSTNTDTGTPSGSLAPHYLVAILPLLGLLMVGVVK